MAGNMLFALCCHEYPSMHTYVKHFGWQWARGGDGSVPERRYRIVQITLNGQYASSASMAIDEMVEHHKTA